MFKMRATSIEISVPHNVFVSIMTTDDVDYEVVANAYPKFVHYDYFYKKNRIARRTVFMHPSNVDSYYLYV